jgi:hypothetical protein
MTTIILLLLVAGICGFGFHAVFGKSAGSIPYYLLAALGGAIVGFTAAVVLGWDFLDLGGLPLFMTVAGSLLFLSLIQRIQIKNE